MRLVIEITEFGNAAFEDWPGGVDGGVETTQILQRYIGRIERNGLEDEATLLDTNGNTVGKVRITRGEDPTPPGHPRCRLPNCDRPTPILCLGHLGVGQ